MRRPLLLIAILAIAAVPAWLWLNPPDLRLSIDRRSRESALLYPREATGRRCAAVVVASLAELTEPERRDQLRTQLEQGLVAREDRVEVGFVPSSPTAATDTPAWVIPGRARLQLRAVPHGYLLVHAAPAQDLLRVASRKRWLSSGLIAAARTATTATIAVGETDDGTHLVATLAFDYRTGEEAEAAFQELMQKQGDFEALGFAARPGADRITRLTKLLVIRFDMETDVVLRALRNR